MTQVELSQLANALSLAIIKAIENSFSDSMTPNFPPGDVPVPVAAKIYGKDPTWIRAGIIAGWLPIGKATRNGKLVTGDANSIDSRKGNISYFISPKKLWEDTGFIWHGEKKADEVVFHIDKKANEEQL